MKEIQVVFTDGMLEKVPARHLDRLIASGEIIRFQRKNGWVRVDTDRIREIKQQHSPDFERRS